MKTKKKKCFVKKIYCCIAANMSLSRILLIKWKNVLKTFLPVYTVFTFEI